MRADAKHIVYRFNGDPADEEVVEDLLGEFPRHQVGDIVERDGEKWKVVHVGEEFTVSGPRHIPVHRVFLTSHL